MSLELFELNCALGNVHFYQLLLFSTHLLHSPRLLKFKINHGWLPRTTEPRKSTMMSPEKCLVKLNFDPNKFDSLTKKSLVYLEAVDD